jgi:hypothetical protein
MAAFAAPLFACDGCFVGVPAIISFVIAVLALIGSIYVLLWSNLGARLGYLVLMVSLFAWMIIMSGIWLFGAPGTTTSTGPRGPEPAWVPFTTDSAAAGDFKDAIASFPSKGWDVLTETGKVYPGKIDAKGEFENVRSAVRNAEAALALKQELTKKFKPEDWNFRASEIPPTTPDEKDPKKFPAATVAYRQQGQTLLFGARIPATATHPETLVFAYRDKGKVFLTALYFLIVSILGFILHLWLLGRTENKQREREAALTSQEPQPVGV